MNQNDPTTINTMLYLWVIGLSSLGGIAGYIKKARNGITIRFSFTELIGEMTISAFAGIITFFICEAAQVDRLISAALVGIAGHMGSRLIFSFEKILQRRLDKIK